VKGRKRKTGTGKKGGGGTEPCGTRMRGDEAICQSKGKWDEERGERPSEKKKGESGQKKIKKKGATDEGKTKCSQKKPVSELNKKSELGKGKRENGEKGEKTQKERTKKGVSEKQGGTSRGMTRKGAPERKVQEGKKKKTFRWDGGVGWGCKKKRKKNFIEK